MNRKIITDKIVLNIVIVIANISLLIYQVSSQITSIEILRRRAHIHADLHTYTRDLNLTRQVSPVHFRNVARKPRRESNLSPF